MQNKLCDTLNVLMAQARINSSELARATGLPATTIKRMRNQAQCNPTISSLTPIAAYFSISINELLGGPQSLPVTTMMSVPLLSWTEVATLNADTLKNTYQKRTTLLDLSKDSYALPVESDELSPFSKGGILFIDRHRKPQSLDYAIIMQHNTASATLKKLIIEDNHYYLKSLVTGVALQPLHEHDQIMGVVAQFQLDLH